MRGTVFSVWLEASRITVRLHEGRVDFTGAAGPIRLRAGESLSVGAAAAARVGPIDDAGFMKDLLIAEETMSLEGPSVPLLRRNIEMSPVEVTGEHSGDARPASGTRSLTKRSSVKGPSPTRRSGSRRSSASEENPTPASAPTDAPPRPFHDPSLDEIEVVPEASLPVDLRLESLIREHAYTSCIDVATKALSQSEAGRDRERVLYLKGYCEMRDGNLKAGREAFERYLIEFPHGRQQKRIQDILGAPSR